MLTGSTTKQTTLLSRGEAKPYLSTFTDPADKKAATYRMEPTSVPRPGQSGRIL